MRSQLINALKIHMQPVTVILTDEKPLEGLHFKEIGMFGCVASMPTAASKKSLVAYFDRKTFKMFREMEASIESSFLEMPAWKKLLERW